MVFNLYAMFCSMNSAYDSEKTNNSLFISYFTNVMNLVVGRIKIDGLPDELKNEEWYINMSMMLGGCAVLYKDTALDKFIMLQGEPIGAPNIYGSYDSYMVHGQNGYTKILDSEDCVVFWDSLTRMPNTYLNIVNFVDRMTDIQRVADVRMFNHKMPTIYRGSAKVVSAIKKMFSKIWNNEPAVFVDDEFQNPNVTSQFINDVKFLNRDLMLYKKDLMHELIMWLGLNANPSEGKKERLLSDEVNANNEMIDSIRSNFMRARDIACEQAKEKFGLDIKFSFIGGEDIGESISEKETE